MWRTAQRVRGAICIVTPTEALVRPGQPTAIYMNTVLTRITLFGALFLATISVVPYFISDALGLGQQIFLGGTSILIVVGVSLDTVRQLESQLMMRNYEGFLKKR